MDEKRLCRFAWKAAVEREINGIIKLVDLVTEYECIPVRMH